MKTAVISFTERGNELNRRITAFLYGEPFESAKNIKELVKRLFNDFDAFVFIGAAGIAVRAVAPNIKSKDTDPAVIVCDELGQYVIPILSGHIGGANELAYKIAEKIGAVSVITTATDINNVWAVDTWAVKNNFNIENIANIKYISSALLKGEKVALKTDFPINGAVPDGLTFLKNPNGIVVSPFLLKPFEHTLNVVPRCINIGVGSRKNADENSLVEAFETLKISKNAVKSVSTIDIKKNEKSVQTLAEYFGVPLITYTADQLNTAEGEFTSSEFVKQITGTDNVCERSAVLSGGELIVNKIKGNEVTIAVSMENTELNFEVE